MKKAVAAIVVIIATSILSIPSFADPADNACNSLGNLAKSAAEARNKGASKDMVMGAMLSHTGDASPQIIQLLATAVEFAYKTLASPESTGQQMSTLCMVEIRKIKSGG